MITCEQCHARFRADHASGYPGHSDPPGSFVVYAGLFLVAAILCAVAGLFVFPFVLYLIAMAFGGGALLSLSSIPEARRVCDRTGGGVCPTCGHQNPVRWYS